MDIKEFDPWLLAREISRVSFIIIQLNKQLNWVMDKNTTCHIRQKAQQNRKYLKDLTTELTKRTDDILNGSTNIQWN